VKQKYTLQLARVCRLRETLMITTKVLGLTEANPKPVRGVNYAGQPMSDDEYYNGRPEHMGPNTTSNSTSYSVTNNVVTDTPNDKTARVERVKRKRRGWTVAAREAASKRWHARRAGSDASDANSNAI
jgi:K+-transporting ATPase c subunit